MEDAHEEPVVVVDDRQGQVVVLVEQPRGGLLVGVGTDARHVGVHQLRHQLPARREHQAAQREHAQQLLVLLVVYQIDVVRLGLFGHPPELCQRLVGRQVRRHRHEVRRHDASRALGRVVQELADVVRLLVLHLVEDRLGLARMELAHDVGRVVRVHLFEDVGLAALELLAEQPRRVEGVELRHDLRQRLVAEPGHQQAELLGIQLPQRLCQLLTGCRVQQGRIRSVPIGQRGTQHGPDVGRDRALRRDRLHSRHLRSE